MITTLTNKMIEYYRGDPKRIQHFLKVHSLSKVIGEGEGINEIDMFILESAALVHDIGIKKAEETGQDCSGSNQEKFGPDEAAGILSELQYCQEDIDRICYLVGHHHTYSDIQGMDYQILVEADFLVNFYEEGADTEAILSALDKVIKTDTGKNLCRMMYGL